MQNVLDNRCRSLSSCAFTGNTVRSRRLRVLGGVLFKLHESVTAPGAEDGTCVKWLCRGPLVRLRGFRVETVGRRRRFCGLGGAPALSSRTEPT